MLNVCGVLVLWQLPDRNYVDNHALNRIIWRLTVYKHTVPPQQPVCIMFRVFVRQLVTRLNRSWLCTICERFHCCQFLGFPFFFCFFSNFSPFNVCCLLFACIRNLTMLKVWSHRCQLRGQWCLRCFFQRRRTASCSSNMSIARVWLIVTLLEMFHRKASWRTVFIKGPKETYTQTHTRRVLSGWSD